ncbi:MAG: ABC transporter ATP-binding protein [Firmicutes bacterium]|nr:ABC transporter ATP-binding protein [Bacillota bacterium]
MPAIEVNNLAKVYSNGACALSDVSFSFPRGKVLTVVGPNGAGKTTLLRILGTNLLPTSGEARVLGYDVLKEPSQVRLRIAMVPQEGRPELYLTVWQSVFCYLLARGFRWKDARINAESAVKAMGLWERRHYMSSQLSGGQRQRVLIAMALATGAEVLILDEPTIGLDPIARRELNSFLGRLRNEATVIITTHMLDEAEYLSDQVMFIDGGKIQAFDSPASLKQAVPVSEKMIFDGSVEHKDFSALGLMTGLGGKPVLYPNSREAAKRVIEIALDQELTVTVQPITLEDVYFFMLGKHREEEEGWKQQVGLTV